MDLEKINDHIGKDTRLLELIRKMNFYGSININIDVEPNENSIARITNKVESRYVYNIKKKNN